jgi:hypothetical protein
MDVIEEVSQPSPPKDAAVLQPANLHVPIGV